MAETPAAQAETLPVHFKVAFISSPEAGELMVRTLTEIGGAPAEKRPPRGLAGPNDLLQILLTGAEWAVWAAKVSAGIIAAGYLGEAGKTLFQYQQTLLKKLAIKQWLSAKAQAPFRMLALIFAGVRTINDTRTIIGIPLTEPGSHGRNMGLEIQGGDPEDLILMMLRFGFVAPQIESAFNEVRKAPGFIGFSQNRDFSYAVQLSRDGEFCIPYTIRLDGAADDDAVVRSMAVISVDPATGEITTILGLPPAKPPTHMPDPEGKGFRIHRPGTP